MGYIRNRDIASKTVTTGKLAVATSGKVLIGQGSTNAPAFKALSGAVSIDADGVTVVQANSLAPSGAFTSVEQAGTGASQNVAHGLGSTPRMVWWALSDLDAGLAAGPPATVTVAPGVHDTTNCKLTVTSGVKFFVFAIK